MDIKNKTCCFTGHRELSPYTPKEVFNETRNVISRLFDKGIIYYGTGGALGFDTVAAEAVLSVQKEHPEVKLILVLPCENQTKYWKEKDIKIYNEIKEKADKVKILSSTYYNGCMQKRNRHLVDCSGYCICFKTKDKGGTAYTVDYAIKNGLKVINIAENL